MIISTRISMEYISTTSLKKYSYGHIYTVKIIFMQGIQSKPEILLQKLREFTTLSNQIKPEASKSLLPLHASIQSSAKIFYKYIGYYVLIKIIIAIYGTSENKQ